MPNNQRTVIILVAVAVGMLGLGFASKPLYDTFCRITGFGGTPTIAEANNSEILDRVMTIEFDANTSSDIPWQFEPEVRSMQVNVGQTGLAYYRVKNLSDEPIVGTATYNVTPIKSATYFVKTECFCFTEQLLQPGEEMSMPVLFHVDPLIEEERRLDEVKSITLSYTFFKVENPTIKVTAAQGRENEKQEM